MFTYYTAFNHTHEHEAHPRRLKRSFVSMQTILVYLRLRKQRGRL